MTRKIFTASIATFMGIIFLASTSIFATSTVTELNAQFKDTTAQPSTPFRFCLWPNTAWPKTPQEVTGISLGVINFGDKKITGADIGIANMPQSVRGGQVSFYNKSQYLEGGQAGIVNFNNTMLGGQMGIYNQSDDITHGGQLGIVNTSKNSQGIQIGIINFMDNGFVKVFPFVNMPKNWFHE